MLSEREKIKHLYNRAAFGISPAALEQESDTRQAIDHLFKNARISKTLQTLTLEDVEEARAKMLSMPKDEVKDLKRLLKKNVFELNNLWLQEMITSEAVLSEKMALFWHGHFACRSVNPYFDQQYLDILRRHALGNFRTMLTEVSKTPAMLQFLNNQQNKKDHPNENFAREVMELFTLGHGHYTEQDIREAARAFTGYGFDKTGSFKFRMQLHDFGTKTVFGQSGNFNGDDVLGLITNRKECAYFITQKLYRYFVDEQVDDAVIAPLADSFYHSGYDIGKLMRSIFASDWFYNEKHVGNKIKSPVELLVSLFRTVPATMESEDSVVFIQRALGQVLLNPPNVAGWPGGRTWIDSSSLLFRMRLPQVIYYDKELDFTPKEEIPEMGMRMMQMVDAYMNSKVSQKLKAVPDWSPVLQVFAASADPVQAIAEAVLSVKPDDTALQVIRSNSDHSGKENFIRSVMIDILSLPEYQLC